ncbi:unnamed protein product [Acanthoscelides obtectus]|uniref:Nuclear protein 1 n=1 Tax=Acanthoscelides obtectus TaxID=200917 RepID=A0A9P0Q0A4_ACAOB|nr:unnamed protein product [Acanthoscelides obtectus]CAH2008404.1 unnamed protein product [Acanthoscelides obtectus]CAK1626403.1 Nuclear protein 1 [Acanthoscelides obtectus]CAK1626426.1 Nuclear protein 1 [Acanthoscelides obtectus]
MSTDTAADQYDRYNYEYDKYIFSGHSGKQRSKKEAEEHTNHFDPSGHSRKLLTKMMNTEKNKKGHSSTSPVRTARKSESEN